MPPIQAQLRPSDSPLKSLRSRLALTAAQWLRATKALDEDAAKVAETRESPISSKSSHASRGPHANGLTR